MGMLSLDKVCIFVGLALIQTLTSSERQYFNHSNELFTWEEARNYCQVCYKDLVALTPDNVQLLIKMIDTDHWIGLRREFPKNLTTDYNSTDSDIVNNTRIVNNTNIVNNSSMVNITDIVNNSSIVNNTDSNYTRTPCKSWCRWSNGDPLIFQNWHAGMPVFKSRLPEIKCCSCSCTCPESTTRITTMPVSLTASPSIQTTVMEYLPKSTGEMKLTTDNEGPSTKIYHDPSSPSQASETTGAGTTLTKSTVGESTTQMDGTRTTNEEEMTTEREEKTTKPANREILLSCTMKESTTPGQTTGQEGISTAGESTTTMNNLRQTTSQEGISTARESTTSMENLGLTTNQDGFSTAGKSTTGIEHLSATTPEQLSTAEDSTTGMENISLTTNQEELSTMTERATKTTNLILTTNQEKFSTAGESTTGMENLSATATQEGISTVGESTTSINNLRQTTSQEGISTARESTTSMENLGLTTNQDGFSTAGKSTTGIEHLSATTPEQLSTAEDSTTGMENISLTTNQEELSTMTERATKTTNLILTTNQEKFSTAGESTTGMENLSATATQEELSTMTERTTKTTNLILTTNQEKFSTAGESTTGMENLSATATQEGISTAGGSTTEKDNLSVIPTQNGISPAGNSKSDMENISLTINQDGFSTVGESTKITNKLPLATNTEGFSTAGDRTSDMENLLSTTNQEGVSTVGESTTKIKNLSETTTQEGFSTVGDSTTHWKGCETTNLESFLTCKVVERTTDIDNCLETSTVSESTTVTEKISVTTIQEQKSTFETDTPFTTDKTTYSPITENTPGMTTDPEGPGTSTQSTITFDAYESSTGSIWTTTMPLMEPTCEQSPLESEILAQINENYIEDSCVVMTSFGPWVERRCLEMLPFICYEDRFYGQVNVTNETSEAATLTWLPGPGDISHHVVEVNGVILNENVTGLTLDLFNLTAGILYDVKVFPVKCDRYLNPQNASFYTRPYKVNNLRVDKVTEKSVHLRWNMTDGSASFYIVKTNDLSKKVNTTDLEFEGLTPGNCYTFSVTSGVLDYSKKSEETYVVGCTKPAKVSDLTVNNITVSSLIVSWKIPEGNYTGFNVAVDNTTDTTSYNLSETELTLKNLMSGTKIQISVRALSYSLMGDITTITAYTAPENVTDVILTPDDNFISVTWKYAGGSSVRFIIKVLKDEKIYKNLTATETHVQIVGLDSSTKYNIIIYAVSGDDKQNILGPKHNESIYTLPKAPTNVRAEQITTNTITLKWDAPDNIINATYRIKVASIWNNSTVEVNNAMSMKFTNLISGTNYAFNVSTIAGNNQSSPASCNAFTDPDKIDISLSALCSSAKSLDCDNYNEASLIKQLDNFLKIKSQVFLEFPNKRLKT